jgi:hypothetical protein
MEHNNENGLLLGCTKTLVKAIDTPACVEHFLLAVLKRMARRTNV